MFGFFRRAASRPLTDAIRRAVEKDGIAPSTADPSQLQMVESGGRYSGRKVTFVRIFLPSQAAQRSLDVRRYTDLDQYQALILRSGHVEADGTVVLSRPTEAQTPPRAARTRAGRAVPDLDVASPAATEAPAP